MKINKTAMEMAEKALEELPVRHRAGEWISKYHVRNLLYRVFDNITKNIEEDINTEEE
mgnify:CR=1 FL=1|tara:strand:+ start:856 stop:1029 length:174 start_codon:yes stop_codon:yes gene_type:complete